MYVLAYNYSSRLRLGQSQDFLYDAVIEYRKFQKHKIKMISSTLGCEVRQELYLANQYEKARQDVGLFFIIYKCLISLFVSNFGFQSGQYVENVEKLFSRDNIPSNP